MKLGRKILLMLSAILATTVVAAGIYLTTTYNYATGELSKTFRVSKVTSGNSKAIQAYNYSFDGGGYRIQRT